MEQEETLCDVLEAVREFVCLGDKCVQVVDVRLL